MFVAQFLDGLDRPPHQYIGGIGPHILRMAVDTAFGDVHLAPALNLCKLGRSIDRKEKPIGKERREHYEAGERQFAGAFAKGRNALRQQDGRTSGGNKGRRNMAEILAHADSHRGARPAGNRVDPAGNSASLLN